VRVDANAALAERFSLSGPACRAALLKGGGLQLPSA
jgi:hypothetical protein